MGYAGGSSIRVTETRPARNPITRLPRSGCGSTIPGLKDERTRAMAVVGFVSEKGGVGKTTACYHIAIALRRYHNKRVLVVDTDYQRGGITCRFIPGLIEHFRSGQLPGITLWDKFQQLYIGQTPTADVDVLDTRKVCTCYRRIPGCRRSQLTRCPHRITFGKTTAHCGNISHYCELC